MTDRRWSKHNASDDLSDIIDWSGRTSNMTGGEVKTKVVMILRMDINYQSDGTNLTGQEK